MNVTMGPLPMVFDYVNVSQQRLVKYSELIVWRCGFVQPGVAGQATMWQVFLPTTAVGRVVQFIVGGRSYSVTTAVEVRRLDVPLGGTSAGVMVADQRSGQVPQVVISSTTGPLPPGAGPVLTVGHSSISDVLSSLVHDRGVILGPGMGLLMVTQAMNVEARVLVSGIEMPATSDTDALKAAYLASYGF